MNHNHNIETLSLDKILIEIERSERLGANLAPQHRKEASNYIEDLKREKERREQAANS